MLHKRIQTPDLLQYANEKRNLQCFNDVSVCAGATSIPANKLVLSCYSRFFEKLFLSEMKEKYQHSIDIENIDGNPMKLIVDYMYTGEIVLTTANAYDLLEAGDYLQIDDLKQSCFKFLKENLSTDNALTGLSIADRYGDDTLKNQATEFISEKLDEVSSTHDFKSLNKDELLTCIAQLDLVKASQTSIYEALIKWSKYDETNRVNHFTELFQQLKLEEIPTEFTEKVIQKEELVTSNLVCLNLLFKSVLATRSKMSEVKEREEGSRILKLGGLKTPRKVTEVFKFNLEEAIQFYPDLPEGRSMACCAKFKEQVFYINGTDTNDAPRKTVWKMNLNNKYLKWEEVSSTNVERSLTNVALLDEKLLVAGGVTRNENDEQVATNSSEYYSETQSKWILVSPMLQKRAGHALVACKGSVYAIGGMIHEGYSLSSVERLDDVKGKWKMHGIKPMKNARYGLIAVNCENYIYAIGGSLRSNCQGALNSAEKYDVNSNEWSDISDMKHSRLLGAAVVHGKKIYVFGGINANEYMVKEIECYDPLSSMWKVVGEISEMAFESLISI